LTLKLATQASARATPRWSKLDKSFDLKVHLKGHVNPPLGSPWGLHAYFTMLVVIINWLCLIKALWEHLLSGYRGQKLFLFYKMVVVLVKEIKLIVAMDDLDFLN
jgi:hypothetical protein